MPQPPQAPARRSRSRSDPSALHTEPPQNARPFSLDFPRLVGGYLFMPHAPAPDSLDDIEGPEGGEAERDR